MHRTSSRPAGPPHRRDLDGRATGGTGALTAAGALGVRLPAAVRPPDPPNMVRDGGAYADADLRTIIARRDDPRDPTRNPHPADATSQILPFVATSQYRAFAELCDARRADRQVAIVIGESGVGKTAFAREYAGWDGPVRLLARYQQLGVVPCTLLARRSLLVTAPRAGIKPLQDDLAYGCNLLSELVHNAIGAPHHGERVPGEKMPGFRALRRDPSFDPTKAPWATELLIVDDAEQAHVNVHDYFPVACSSEFASCASVAIAAVWSAGLGMRA